MKKIHWIVLIVLCTVVVGAGLYVYLKDDTEDVRRDIITYIDAIRAGDFKTVFDYHAPSQRRRLLIIKRSHDDVEDLLEELYKEQKESFEQAPFTTDLTGEWSEKFIFPRDSDYRIVDIEMVVDTENPSQPLKDIVERINAVVTVGVNYRDKSTAPDINGKVKRATYRIKMIHSENVARTLRGEVEYKRWLFKAISVVDGSIEYW